MKEAAGFVCLVFLLCIILPSWLSVQRGAMEERGRSQQTTSVTQWSRTEPPEAPVFTGTDLKQTIVVLHADGVCRPTDLETYLTGVLLGEMPLEFPLEARKAQAVVCRTYTLRRLGSGKHGEADICTDSSCCQAWRDPESYEAEQRRYAQEAVDATDGQVLTYGGQLIDATFFSCSGGRTEAAVAVWGTDIPYLQSVDSPDENAPYDEDRISFTEQEFRALLEPYAPNISLEGEPAQWFSQPTYTEGGSVDTIAIGGVTFTGKELRGLLGLRSAAFTVETGEGTVTVITRGYGHRVGMSQYGARSMALRGAGYRDILSHYYTDTTLAPYQSP